MKKYHKNNGTISVQAQDGKWVGSLPAVKEPKMAKKKDPPVLVESSEGEIVDNEKAKNSNAGISHAWETLSNKEKEACMTELDFSEPGEVSSLFEKFSSSTGTRLAFTLAEQRNPDIPPEVFLESAETLHKEAVKSGMHNDSFSDSKVYSWVDDQILYVLTEAPEGEKFALVKELELVATEHSKGKNVNYADLYAWKHLESVARASHARSSRKPDSQKKVAVDVDGVLYDVDGVMWRWLVNQGYTPPEHEIRTYSLGENWGVGDTTIKEEFGKAVDAGFMFRYGDSFKESVNAVKRIYQTGHKVSLVTARDLKGREKRCMQATLKWLRDNNVPFDDLHLTHEKEKVDFDILIDDAPGNVERVMSWGKRGYILHRPWNRDEGEGYDRGTWVDILMHLEGGSGRAPKGKMNTKNREAGEVLGSQVKKVGTVQPNDNNDGKDRPISTA